MTIRKKLTNKHLLEVAKIFKVLGDPTRTRLVYALCHEELSVSKLCDKVEIGQSGVSHQLAKLKAQRIVKQRRDGNNIFYSIDDSHIARLFREAVFHLEHVKENIPDIPYPGITKF